VHVANEERERRVTHVPDDRHARRPRYDATGKIRVRAIAIKEIVASAAQDCAQLRNRETSSYDIACEPRAPHERRGGKIRARHRTVPWLDWIFDHVSYEVELVHDARSTGGTREQFADLPRPRECNAAHDHAGIQKPEDEVQASSWTPIARRVVQEEDADLATNGAHVARSSPDHAIGKIQVHSRGAHSSAHKPSEMAGVRRIWVPFGGDSPLDEVSRIFFRS
jgi:hypothetical protein